MFHCLPCSRSRAVSRGKKTVIAVTLPCKQMTCIKKDDIIVHIYHIRFVCVTFNMLTLKVQSNQNPHFMKTFFNAVMKQVEFRKADQNVYELHMCHRSKSRKRDHIKTLQMWRDHVKLSFYHRTGDCMHETLVWKHIQEFQIFRSHPRKLEVATAKWLFFLFFFFRLQTNDVVSGFRIGNDTAPADISLSTSS